MKSCVIFFALIGSYVHGRSCNYYGTIGIAEDICNVLPYGDFSQSYMFSCVDESTGSLTFWNGDDCSSDDNFTRKFSDTSEEEFSCSTNSDGCNIFELIVQSYEYSSNCSGGYKSDGNNVYYLTDYSIDCQHEPYHGYYYSRTLSVPDGLLIEYYNGGSCENLDYTVTYSNRTCAEDYDDGRSITYTLKYFDRGTITSANLYLLNCLMVFVVVINNIVVVP